MSKAHLMAFFDQWSFCILWDDGSCIDECIKELSLAVVWGKHFFRMPLYSDEKTPGVGSVRRFDDAF